MTADEFRLNLNLHHPSCDPHEITEGISLVPWFSVKHGAKIGEIVHRKTAWLCHFKRGSGSAEFDAALEDTLSFLSDQKPFLSRFVEQGGEIELELNSATDSAWMPGDKMSELSFHPQFLRCLAENNIHLRLQIWASDSGDRSAEHSTPA